MRDTERSFGVGAILEVDVDAVAGNWRTLCGRHPAGAVGAVVKADAYGLGARLVAPRLYREGCRHFFVAKLDEALAIRPRESGDLVPGAMLAVLGGLPAGTEAEFAAAAITPVLGSLAEVAAWAEQARKLGRRLPALLHVDTGMSRLGLDGRELALQGSSFATS